MKRIAIAVLLAFLLPSCIYIQHREVVQDKDNDKNTDGYPLSEAWPRRDFSRTAYDYNISGGRIGPAAMYDNRRTRYTRHWGYTRYRR